MGGSSEKRLDFSGSLREVNGIDGGGFKRVILFGLCSYKLREGLMMKMGKISRFSLL